MALLGVSLVTGASAAGALNVAHAHAPVSNHDASSSAVSWGQPTPLPSSQPHTSPAHFVTPPEPHVGGTSTPTSRSTGRGSSASGSTYSGISAEWTVPAVQPTGVTEASATWLGIDNGNNLGSDIIQTGTAQQTQDGVASYYAWYELFPAPAVYIGQVSPGDVMDAYVEQDSGTSWTINIADATVPGDVLSQPVTYNGPAVTAEWIEELPEASVLPNLALANFGSATFTSLGLTPSAGTIAPVDMVDQGGNVIASTSTITGAGSFTVTYVPELTVTHVSANPGSSSFGSAVTYATTVNSWGPTPTGTVAFTDGSTALCTATLSGGSGSCVATNTPQGSGVVQGRYSGDVNSAPSSGTTGVDVSPALAHGYWLVGSDGGIFTFGVAKFWGSTGVIELQRPVVGIVPTSDRNGYWLDASDGGVFAYGDTQFYGSIPGLGLHPAGSGLPNSLNAPIVGHGAVHRRRGLLHGGLRRRGVRVRRCAVRRDHALESGAARVRRSRSCPTTAATATGW